MGGPVLPIKIKKSEPIDLYPQRRRTKPKTISEKLPDPINPFPP
jgi:hypothetical protein